MPTGGAPLAAPAWPPGYAPYPPTPTSGTSFRTIILIAVVVVTVLVLGTVLVAALLYVMVSGLTTGPTPDDTMGLAAGSWSGGAIEIQVLSGPSDVAGVADPTYLVYDAQGVLYFNGHTGETQAVGGTSVTVTQLDANTNGILDAGDSIEVRVSPASDTDGFLGGTLFITGSGGETFGSIHI